MPELPVLTIGPPVYLVVAQTACWKCDRVTPVVTLGTERIREEIPDPFSLDDEGAPEFFILSNIVALSDTLLAFIHEYCPRYRRTYSRTAQASYFMNHCFRCDASMGDWFMHDEPGGAFFPEGKRDIRRLLLVKLPIRKPISLSASYGVHSNAHLILKHATKQDYRP